MAAAKSVAASESDKRAPIVPTYGANVVEKRTHKTGKPRVFQKTAARLL